ncbi:ribosomal protein S5 [Dionaea muscipula]
MAAARLSSPLSVHPSRFSLLSPSPSPSHGPPSSLFTSPLKPLFISSTSNSNPSLLIRAKSDGVEVGFSNGQDPEDIKFNPPEAPDDLPSGQAIDPFETEEMAREYEALYGPAFSGESFLGNDVFEMDSEIKEPGDGWDSEAVEQVRDGLEERVVEVRRVNKVTKGGRRLNFRAVVVVGDKQGKVGVGHGKAGEVGDAVRKAAIDARRHLIMVPMTKYMTFPHRSDADYGAARVMLRPAAAGTGVIAGGAVRVVLELAGVENALGKQLGSDNPLNNARAAVAAISKMRQFREVALERGIPMEELWK